MSASNEFFFYWQMQINVFCGKNVKLQYQFRKSHIVPINADDKILVPCPYKGKETE